MPRVLVEIDDFTASITVPEAGDARSDAAEVVADIGQRLANRTVNLQALDALKAVLADANIFTAAPQSVDSTDNEVALFQSPRSSLDDASVGGTNDWKLIENWAADHTRWVRMYSGGNDAAGHFVLTINAHWHKSDSKWRPDTTGKDSFAMFVINETMVISRQAAGPSSWTTFPANAGDIIAGNAVTATTLNATTDVNAFANCNVAGDVVVAGEVKYPLPTGFKSRTKLIPLADAIGTAGATPRIDANGNVEAIGAGDFVWWPIVLPRGSQLVKVEWIHGQSTTSPSLVDVQRRTAANYGTPSTPTFASIGGGVAGPASSGVKLTSNTASLPITISESEEYRAVWLPGASGAGADNVQQIRVTFNDPGARSN